MSKGAPQRRLIVCLIAAAFVLRAFSVFQTPVISKDGVIYIQDALHFSRAEFAEGMQPYPPVYSALIAFGYTLVHDAEKAAQWISAIMGSLALIPFYHLTRSVFGPRIAYIAGWLFVFQPALIRASGDVLSEPTYLFFFLCAFCAAERALREGKRSAFIQLGIWDALAYLTRPEGMGIMVGTGIGVGMICLRRYNPSLGGGRLARWPMMGRFLLGAGLMALLIAPYVMHIHNTTGEWRLNAKRNMLSDSGLERAIQGTTPMTTARTVAPLPYRGFKPTDHVGGWIVHYLETLGGLVIAFIEVFHYLLFAFFCYGILRRRLFSFNRNVEGFLMGMIGLYLALMALLYVDGRHLLQLIPLVLPWAAAGLMECVERFEQGLLRAPRLGWKGSTQAVALMLTLAVLLPKMLYDYHENRFPLKEAGSWIQVQYGSARTILASDLRIAYYAQAKYVPFRHSHNILRMFRKGKVDFLALRTNDPLLSKDLFSPAFGKLHLKAIYQTPYRPGIAGVIVYHLSRV